MFQALCLPHPQLTRSLRYQTFSLQYTAPYLTIVFSCCCVNVHSNPNINEWVKNTNKYFNVTCKLKIQRLSDLHYASLHAWPWLAAALGLSVWQQPSNPPSNSLFLMPWWFSASEGLFCSIQRGNHGNGSLTLSVLLQLRQAWPEFLTASSAGGRTRLGQLTCFWLLTVKKLCVSVKTSGIKSTQLWLALCY